MAWPLRNQVQRARAFQHAIDVISKLVAVVDHGKAIPSAERMQTLAIEQRPRLASGKSEAVEAPPAIDHADLREHPGVRILAGLGVLLLQMEKTLFRRATRIGAEDDLPSEHLGSRQRMDVHKEGVIDTVKLDGLAHGRIDDSRVTQHGSLMPADR